MSTVKAMLLESLIAYLVRRGVADVSLRPMAAAVGTSARLLIFHFGSKERLLVEVLGEMQSRLQRSLNDLLVAEPGESRSAPLRQFWDWALKDPNFAQLRVVYQLHILAAQDHKTYGRYLKRNSLNWLELVQAVVKPAQRSPTLATLIVAVFDGLFIEVMSTGDRRRASAAIDEFITMARKHTNARRSVRKHALSKEPA
jgi:AcrR family transcriptional regulator